jgi:hypothetical protein
MRKYYLFLILIAINLVAFAQDSTYAREMMLTLGSKDFMGRGYVGDGNKKAADFIAKQFETNGLKKFNDTYFQEFTFPINTIQEVNYFVVGGDTLVPGTDYYVLNASKSRKGNYKVIFIDDSLFTNDGEYLKSILMNPDLENSFLVFNKMNNEARYNFKTSVGGLIFLNKDKLSPWSFSHAQEPASYAIIDVLESKFSKDVEEIEINFKSKFYSKFNTQNVVSYIEGTKYPDSFIVIGAHYDHMGMMGQEVVFPGGNDNLSGTAMLLNLAKYFSKDGNRPEFSIAFISFSGEEVGLLGSLYYVQHPLFDLKSIHFMLNLDMVGTGSKGIVVVNGSVFKNEFKKLEQINMSKKYLARVKVRGEACNSDHCPFYMKKVPSFFIYTTGDEYSEYHSPTDLPQSVPLTNYNGVFKLIRDFIKEQ